MQPIIPSNAQIQPEMGSTEMSHFMKCDISVNSKLYVCA